jgi:exopolyphosphatase/guanosine-5'-triphosphate,3'-diphosphate pyrophosphatase
MRLAVLDVGSNTLNMLVTDSGRGVPLPVRAWKSRTCLSGLLEPDGAIGAAGRRRLVAAVAQAADEAGRAEVDQLFPYATAVIRDAPNRDQVLEEVAAATGIRLGLLSGAEEAQLTFLAARRWLGWQAGPMLLADIGGGTLEVAVGPDRLPDVALSLPLGARGLTRRFLYAGDPPPERAVRALRRHVREQIDQVAARASWEAPATAVATSKTFQQLARLTGAAPLRRGPFVTRRLGRRQLRPWIDRLAALPSRERARLPGVSVHRARQILAGAIVAYEVMRRLDIDSLRICPWALREGILLRHLETRQPPLGGAVWVPWRSPQRHEDGRRSPIAALTSA